MVTCSYSRSGVILELPVYDGVKLALRDHPYQS